MWGEDTNDKQRDKLIAQMLSAVSASDQKRRGRIRLLLDRNLRGGAGAAPEANAAIIEPVLTGTDEFDKLAADSLGTAFRDALDITEYGRAVHAEMDALLTCARSGVSPSGGILYVTTFPCHNCTRHIIAAGIKRVFYIEPYAKSRAQEPHEDAIIVEERVFDKQVRGMRRVPFTHFVGIGPRRYFDLFSMRLSKGYDLIRKKSGRTLKIEESGAWTRIPLSPYSYLKKEEIAVKILDDLYSQQLDFFDTRNGT